MVLQVKDICKTFEGAPAALEVLRNIRFTVDAGEVISIIGPSGCGKTTLLRIMHGLEPGTQGEVFRFPASACKSRRRRARWCFSSSTCSPG